MMSDNPQSTGRLSICIPTWNRNRELSRTISMLIPQIQPGVDIVVLDNCSNIPVSETLPAEFIRHVKIIRHAVNLGSCANVMRCFEVAVNDW